VGYTCHDSSLNATTVVETAIAAQHFHVPTVKETIQPAAILTTVKIVVLTLGSHFVAPSCCE
jgi:hypothetical protein